LTPPARLILVAQLLAAALLAGVPGVVPAGEASGGELAVSLDRLGERVANYYRHAQRILATESVRIQPLASDLTGDGFGRRLVYELRLQWDETDTGAIPEPKAIRRLLLVDGRAPRPKDEPKCMDPRAVDEDPLTMLLPSKREEFSFSLGKDGKVDGRPVKTLEFRAKRPNGFKPEDATWKEDCVSISLDGFVRGRIRVDAESGDVLRFEQHLSGPVDVSPPVDRPHDGSWRVLERWDQFISYKPVTFRDPDETLMVPSSVETISILRGAGTSRVRTTQTFSAYRRFVSESRIIK
jgi:hypothetical protein